MTGVGADPEGEGVRPPLAVCIPRIEKKFKCKKKS
jgi:hypothetical protein